MAKLTNQIEASNLPPLEDIFTKTKIKILKVLCEEDDLSIAEIERRSNVSYPTCVSNLKELTNQSILKERIESRIRLYTLRTEIWNIRKLKKFIQNWK